MANRIVKLSMDDALENPKLLGQFVQGKSWGAWRTLWRSAFALPPRDGDLATFKLCTGRENWPSRPARELWAIIGRRGGKSMNVGLLGTYTAAFLKYPQLAPGEVATIPIISPTRQQSKVIKGYIGSFFQDNPYLRGKLIKETTFQISLANRIEISIMSSDFRSLRGFSCPLVILEEASFFYQEGARTDTEAVRAVRPALATFDGLLCVISSPFGKMGAVWEAYSKYYGIEGDVLIWKAASKFMNPLLDQSLIDRAMAEDSEASASEWGAEFRSDISSYISPEVADQCVVRGCHERGPLEAMTYSAFCDMAGGSGQDSATLAIAHSEGGKAVLDCLREVRPPFSPEQVVAEFSNTLKRYRCQQTKGDRFAGDWPKESFSRHGVSYETETRSKSELYIELIPLLNSGLVELLESDTLRRQLCSLERRTHAGGRQSVDHAPRGHDDLINSAAGALLQSQSLESEQPWEIPYAKEPQYRINEIGEKVSLQNLGGPGKGAFFVERKPREPWDRDW